MRSFSSCPFAACCLLGCAAALLSGQAPASEPLADVTRAVIVIPADLSGQEKKAVAMLVDEVEKRTQIRWRHSDVWPSGALPVIAVGQEKDLRKMHPPAGLPFSSSNPKPQPEGYQIRA